MPDWMISVSVISLIKITSTSISKEEIIGGIIQNEFMKQRLTKNK